MTTGSIEIPFIVHLLLYIFGFIVLVIIMMCFEYLILKYIEVREWIKEKKKKYKGVSLK